jgi:hypothetical protein
VRHVFEDLLKLADVQGLVDMTQEAVARRTNVPLEIVRRAIEELSGPDKRSRSPESQGRRLVRIDPDRDWGWKIVNYEKYRAIQNQESRRTAWKESKKRYRERLKGHKPLPGETQYVRAVENGEIDPETGEAF